MVLIAPTVNREEANREEEAKHVKVGVESGQSHYHQVYRLSVLCLFRDSFNSVYSILLFAEEIKIIRFFKFNLKNNCLFIKTYLFLHSLALSVFAQLC